MSKEIPTRAPWGAPNAEEWDKITYLEFIDRTCWTKTGRALAEYLIVTLAAAEAHEGSLLWLLWSIKQCGGIGSLLAVRNGAQEYKLEGGMMQVSEKIAESLKGSVHLSSPVASVSQTAEEVVVETTDGEKYRGSHCNLALAPPMQMRLHYSPPLPASRNQLLQRLSMGSVWKCLVYYKEAFWRRMGYTGCLEFTPYEDCILTLTLDDTKPDGKHPAIIGFLEGKRARSFAHMITDERKQKMVDSLARAFCTDEALNPIHYEEFNWSADQYSGGCYTCVMPPGALTSFRGVLRDPVGRLFFAGTETAVEWTGYISGAVEAGERAAREVLCAGGMQPRQPTCPSGVERLGILDGWLRPAAIFSRHVPSAFTFITVLASVAMLVGVAAAAKYAICVAYTF